MCPLNTRKQIHIVRANAPGLSDQQEVTEPAPAKLAQAPFAPVRNCLFVCLFSSETLRPPFPPIQNGLWPQSPRCSKGVVASRNFLELTFLPLPQTHAKGESDSFGAVASDKCLSYENDHKMRGLDFREIQPRNNVFISGNKSRPRTVWTANKLKAYENQTKQSHGGSPSVSES